MGDEPAPEGDGWRDDPALVRAEQVFMAPHGLDVHLRFLHRADAETACVADIVLTRTAFDAWLTEATRNRQVWRAAGL
jgi:hypothetical protein